MFKVDIVATLVLMVACLHPVSSFDSRNIVFTIVSQADPYHASVASRLKQDIENQVFDIERRRPKVHLTHEDFPIRGAWTIVPLFRPLLNKYKGSDDVRWVLFFEPHTAVRCSKLLDAMATADQNTDIMWIGYPLSDEEPLVIHHFFFDFLGDGEEFVYPYFSSGFAMRMELIETLLKRRENGDIKIETNFVIDPAFELARFVYGDAINPGPLLTAGPSFCIVPGDNCATYPRQFDICGSPIPEETIFFAVKTWSGFHSTRAKVVKRTWGKHVTNLMFYSDKSDPSLPAIETGIPNSKIGHCAKTVAILKLAVKTVKNLPHVKWIFLADDDTILGVQRLCEVLSCYRGGDDLTFLGERFGFRYLIETSAEKGQEYITGGAGMVLSIGAARAISKAVCSLADIEDMSLGEYARILNLTLTHSPLFHQGQPQDYPREVLARDRPVTFHRHSYPNPERVYATWFQHDDLAIGQRKKEEL